MKTKWKAILVCLLAAMCLAACGKKPVTDEQALSGVINYCCARNPELESIAEYPVYWEQETADGELTVLFRSYTGAQQRFHIDRDSGETWISEFVPGVTPEEVRTGETFNVRDYLD